MPARPFRKLLIANRGEIACRIIRTARAMGLRTVAVYSDADAQALHVSMADEAIRLGPAPARESYLDAGAVLEACRRSGAEAVHPGYGFLSENAVFARACEQAGLYFVGPPASAIESMGSKSAAKALMEQAGVPLVPGYHGQDQKDARLFKAAAEMGYPVLLKAVAGGGGKGMRRVDTAQSFYEALASARRESQASFGNSDMLVEKFIEHPRHVEIQVFCDGRGGAVYLFERDCSVQRRHQKVIEEAPAPGMTAELRQQMGEAAVRAARAIGYVGAGTVEFLLDSGGEFHFMEMNTRLQVEHPVTEMITGQDLVEWQLRVAMGEALPLAQEQLTIHGHAIEARIYAEDPEADFMPCSGRLHYHQPPQESSHVRVDTGVMQGDEISVHYDPMIAKLITWDSTREKALSRMETALRRYRIGGVQSNVSFLFSLVSHPAFRAAELDTGFIEKHQDSLFHVRDFASDEDLALAALYLLLRREVEARQGIAPGDSSSPWLSLDGWRLNQPSRHHLAVSLHGEEHEFVVEEIRAGGQQSASNGWRMFELNTGERRLRISGELDGNHLLANLDGHRRNLTVAAEADRFTLFSDQGAVQFERIRPDLGEEAETGGDTLFRAPMNGVVVKCLVEPGQRVEAGAPVVVTEAMKMEHLLRAPVPGVVAEFHYQPGDQVESGAVLLRFEPDH